jgi:putative ABC transport system substrate-binding protein
MRRREFLGALGGAAAAWPVVGRAQPKKTQLGVLVLGSADSTPLINTLKEGLRQLGHVEGENVEFHVRSAGGSTARLPLLARELVELNVALIVAFQTPAITAAKQATTEIPIIMGASGDPVRTGLVVSLARPGGNVTGMSGVSGEIGGKNLQLIREVVPTAGRVGVLANVPDPFHKPFLETIQASARILGIEIRPLMVTGPEQLDAAFSDIVKERLAAVIVQPTLPHKRVIELALKHGLPTIAPNADYAVAGGLMSYSADQLALAREASAFVDKILKGRKPADLPVQLATKFVLVVNLKTARALGLTISPALLARADEVIE